MNNDSPTRQAIKAMLRQKMTAPEMARALDITPQAVHKHLKKMGATAKAGSHRRGA